MFIRRCQGSRMIDVTGREYVDLVMGWGSLLLGHAHPEVVEAVKLALERGWNTGALTEEEVRMAGLLCESVSGMDMVRLVNSGTEATMSAVRLARAFTGRDKVIKFEECYHGHADGLLTTGHAADFSSRPATLGVPLTIVGETLTLPFNDIEALSRAFEQYGQRIAAVIAEPIPGNAGVILPRAGFLASMRELCDRWGALLIFDEVITGFRFRFGDCGIESDVKPDIVCLGKIIGGGLPVGAFGGRREIMEMVSPLGGVFQAGTFSGNLASVTSGLKTLELIKDSDPYSSLEQNGSVLQAGLEERAAEAGVKVSVSRYGSMLSLSFSDGQGGGGEGRERHFLKYKRFFHEMLGRGVYLPPSPVESWFLSAAHSEEDINRILEASGEAFRKLRGEI